jgi:hypothetical protein
MEMKPKNESDFPEADHAQNPPPIIGKGVRRSTQGEIIEYHKNNGSLDDEVLNYCGIYPDRGIDRGR